MADRAAAGAARCSWARRGPLRVAPFFCTPLPPAAVRPPASCHPPASRDSKSHKKTAGFVYLNRPRPDTRYPRCSVGADSAQQRERLGGETDVFFQAPAVPEGWRARCHGRLAPAAHSRRRSNGHGTGPAWRTGGPVGRRLRRRGNLPDLPPEHREGLPRDRARPRLGPAHAGRHDARRARRATGRARRTWRRGATRPKIRSFKALDAIEASATCTTCHNRGTHLLWANSAHENRQVGCLGCHGIHTFKSDKRAAEAGDRGRSCARSVTATRRSGSSAALTCRSSRRRPAWSTAS